MFTLKYTVLHCTFSFWAWSPINAEIFYDDLKVTAEIFFCWLSRSDWASTDIRMLFHKWSKIICSLSLRRGVFYNTIAGGVIVGRLVSPLQPQSDERKVQQSITWVIAVSAAWSTKQYNYLLHHSFINNSKNEASSLCAKETVSETFPIFVPTWRMSGIFSAQSLKASSTVVLVFLGVNEALMEDRERDTGVCPQTTTVLPAWAFVKHVLIQVWRDPPPRDERRATEKIRHQAELTGRLRLGVFVVGIIYT